MEVLQAEQNINKGRHIKPEKVHQSKEPQERRKHGPKLFGLESFECFRQIINHMPVFQILLYHIIQADGGKQKQKPDDKMGIMAGAFRKLLRLMLEKAQNRYMKPQI
jgi:hypothetical protein